MTNTAVEATEERPLRPCDICGGVDDHPRHQIAHPPGTVIANPEIIQLLAQNVDFTTERGAKVLADYVDTTVEQRHMDCCREAGCPDGTCNVVTQGAESLRGTDLLDHLQSREGETYFVAGRPESEVRAEIVAAAPPESRDPQAGPQSEEF